MIAGVRELARSNELFRILVWRQLKIRGSRSRFSEIWPIFSPFFLMILYVFVFKRVFNVGIPRYPQFMLCGILPWAFVSQVLGKTTGSLSSEPEVIRKSRFPYALLPLSATMAHALSFLGTISVFLVWLAVDGVLPLSTLPALVLPLVAVILLAGALAMMVALLDVYNRDFQLILPNLLTIWFFLLPIVYRPEMTPGPIEFLRSIDPLSLIVVQMRAILYYGEIQRPDYLVTMLVLCVALFVLCLTLFRKLSHSLPKDV